MSARSGAPASGPLRVLVAPHNFEIGGSQIVALELAGALADSGDVEVTLYAPDGELADRARRLGVDLHLTTLRESAPSPSRIRELGRLARDSGADLVHAYEWAPTIDAAYGAAWGLGVPVVSTILSMDYPYFLPKTVPMIMGTRDLHAQALAEGRTAHLIEPPVDTELFAPAAVPAGAVASARRECGAAEEEILVVVVGRLAARLKLDGLLALVRAVTDVAGDDAVRLAIVGDGPQREEIADAAARANAHLGRDVVRLLGSRDDPRAYYLAAEIVVGMGSSALRALSLGKAVLVQGEGGFWRIADPDSAPLFLAQGWYGVDDTDAKESAERCATALRTLIRRGPTGRAELGAFGRRLIAENYSLTAAASTLAGIYREVATHSLTRGGRLSAAAGQSFEIMKFRTARRLDRIRTARRREVA